MNDGPALRGAVRFWPASDAGAALTAGVIGALVIAPVVSLAVIAASSQVDPEVWGNLYQYVLPNALVQTALLLLGVAIVAVVAGTGTAWLVTTFQFPGRNILLWLLPLPLAIPTYIGAYIYVAILDASGPVQTWLRAVTGWKTAADYWFPPVRSLGGAIFVMGVVLYPYVYLAARAMFQTQGAVFAETGRTLGARPWALMRQVTLPLARPALAVGTALVLLETLNDIGASEYLGVQTLTISVFTTWLNRGSLAGAAQLSLIMLVAVIALIALERYGRRRQSYAAASQDTRVASRITLTGRNGWIAMLACLVPVSFGFLIPFIFLVREVLIRGLMHGFDAELARHTVTTVMLAACATAAVLLLGLACAVALRMSRGRFVTTAVAAASLGYAIPGTVLALGLLSPLVGVDAIINGIAKMLGFGTLGLVLAGSSAAVVIAYTVRFLAIGTGFIQAGFTRISPEIDDAARQLGAPPLVLVRTIHLPLIRPALWGAALLVFVDCLKELPLTLLLRPLNVETLSTFIYQFATRGDFEQGSLAALLIVAAGILPVIRIIRYADMSPGSPEPIQ